MPNERWAYPKNCGPRTYKNDLKKSAIAYFIKLVITRNVLEEDVDLVVISEKTDRVDCNTKAENPISV